jgi:hypothetical protein
MPRRDATAGVSGATAAPGETTRDGSALPTALRASQAGQASGAAGSKPSFSALFQSET